MKPSSSRAKIFILLILLAALFFTFRACVDFVIRGFPAEPGLTITVHNQTNELLRIYHDGEVFVGEAVPGGEITYLTYGDLPKYSVVAKDIISTVVYSAYFTRDDLVYRIDDLNKRGKYTYRVVIPPMARGEQSDNVTGR